MTSDTQRAGPGSAYDPAEASVDFMLGLIDLTVMRFTELAKLDESLVDETLDRLLPRGATLGSRRWDQDKVVW